MTFDQSWLECHGSPKPRQTRASRPSALGSSGRLNPGRLSRENRYLPSTRLIYSISIKINTRKTDDSVCAQILRSEPS